MIKAIETVYKGYRFRSRLEARWAVFFDAIKLEWLYEHEGFVLADNQLYLPDFWFPELNCFAEVKPKLLTLEEYNKCVMLPHPCILLDTQTPRSKHGYFITQKTDDQFINDRYNNYKYYSSSLVFLRTFLEMCARKKHLWFVLDDGDEVRNSWFDDVPEIKAKSARFEHSERSLA